MVTGYKKNILQETGLLISTMPIFFIIILERKFYSETWLPETFEPV